MGPKGTAGKTCVIEYTSDLRSGVWTPVPAPVVTLSGPGFGRWVDDGTLTGGLTVPFRAYRVKF